MICITLDVDWAPDFAIDFAADRLIAAGVKATWLITHASPAIDRLRKRPDLFELGIHPNFLANSTHGRTPEEVIGHCLRLVPGAISMRTHSQVQSWEVLDLVIRTTGIMVDASIFLPGAENVSPTLFTVGKNQIVRLPFVWEDDYEMLQESPRWDAGLILDSPGIKVFNFHPVHVLLNSGDLGRYVELKRRVGPALQRAVREDAIDLIALGRGTRTVFDELLGLTAGAGKWLRDFAVPRVGSVGRS